MDEARATTELHFGPPIYVSLEALTVPESPVPWQYDDGGRAEAGFKGVAGDCVCRSIAIATQRPYADVYRELNEAGQRERASRRRKRRSAARTGVHKPTLRRYLDGLGWQWTATMRIGQGCMVHLRPDELPSGRLIVQVSKHVTTLIDGVVHDTYDCSRDGTRCVYGYWQREGS